jgi:integrase
MPSITKRGKKWRVEVSIRGERQTATFRTKQEAAAWALEREAELSGAKLPDHSLGDALKRYREKVSPTKRGERWETLRLKAMEADPIAKIRLPVLATPDLAGWRDRRLAEVAPGTVAREMNLLRAVLRLAWKEWHWLRANPLSDVKPPKEPASRKRRVSQDEIDRLLLACGVEDTETTTAMQRTGLAFAFAVETAMRAGEIVGMRWEEVGPKSVTLPRTKNGEERRVPLSPRAREIIAAMPKDGGTVFGLEPGTRDVMFRRARDAAQLANLHFHDSRAEAIWRLSKKLDVMELARVIGHRDLKSLMLYYQTDADELADRL